MGVPPVVELPLNYDRARCVDRSHAQSCELTDGEGTTLRDGWRTLRNGDRVARAHVLEERALLRPQLVPRLQRARTILQEAAGGADDAPRLERLGLRRLLRRLDGVGVLPVHVRV